MIDHGFHWGCLFNNSETLLKDFIPKALKSPEYIDQSITGYGKSNASYMTAAYPQSDLSALMLFAADHEKKELTLNTAFPYCREGKVHTVTLLETRAETDTPEGVHRILFPKAGEEEPFELSIYDPRFLKNHTVYSPGASYQFALAGLAYSVSPAEQENLPETETPFLAELRKEVDKLKPPEARDESGESRNLSGVTMMFPLQEGEQDEMIFRAKVVQAETLSFDDIPVYRLTCVMLRREGFELLLPIYAAAHKVQENYKPAAGDEIVGACWLQGSLSG